VSGSDVPRLAVAIEGTGRKVFAAALDWPGWARAGKTEQLAVETLLAYAPRYASVVRLAGIELGERFAVEVDERGDGSSGTEFGVPSRIFELDARPVDRREAERLASIVEAAWSTFEHVRAGAPAELRKGPRGGGRDRDKMAAHVIEADWSYARELGLKLKSPSPDDSPAVRAAREQVLAVLREPSDGAPLAGRTWTLRYAARRIAWHALDHAWEMEDRSE
jgi:hypothetical protein